MLAPQKGIERTSTPLAVVYCREVCTWTADDLSGSRSQAIARTHGRSLEDQVFGTSGYGSGTGVFFLRSFGHGFFSSGFGFWMVLVFF